MVSRTSDWRDELGGWLKPFLDRLGHKARRQMCPLYVSGLIGPGDRKSVQPMAKRLALGACDRKGQPGWRAMVAAAERLGATMARIGLAVGGRRPPDMLIFLVWRLAMIQNKSKPVGHLLK
jgi:hypothetical protein